MARVALIKLFTGLNLGVSQLSGDLRRAGHDTRIIYFKDFLCVPAEETHRYLVTDYALTNVAERGREYVWNCYTPFSDREYDLLFELLEEFHPDLIGFSLTALPMKAAAEVTAKVKQRFDVPVIWGGPGPTIQPQVALEHADLVCHGEGEELIVELANRLDTGADYADIPGLWLKRDGEIVRNPDAPLLDLDAIAIPDFDPARTFHVNDDTLRRNVYPLFLGTQYVIMTQRGCPFSCSFCVESVYQDMFGKKNSLRRRSVDLVIEELVAAKRTLNIRHVMFYDDVFTVNPRWLREFAPRYKAEVGLPFWCYTYPTTTRREDILLLKDAGLRSITMGIQSGSDEILKDFNRPVAQQRAHEAAKIIAECGVEAYFDLITKVEFEKDEHCRQTFEFLLDFPREMRTVGFGAMVSFPEYGYTRRVAETNAQLSLSQREYTYYHKLYLLTRTRVPRPVVKAIGTSRLFRRYPWLIDPLLPKKLPMMFLSDDNEYADEVLNLPHAQAIIPGGRLDRGADAAEAAAQA
ncbi:MAG TPA: radical SAM protein [Candidatus Binatia bacterium]|nr:radical SAM protein [Candidatus Binatia bacterium]